MGNMMRILPVNPEPIIEIPFLNAGRGPGGFYEDRLPILDAVLGNILMTNNFCFIYYHYEDFI